MVIDDLKILIDAVAELEGAAIYLIIAFFGYRLIVFGATTAAIVKVLTLFITKSHDWLTTKKVVNEEVVVKLDGEIIAKGDAVDILKQAISLAKTAKQNYSDKYLHNQGCKFVFDAVRDKLAKEAKDEK